MEIAKQEKDGIMKVSLTGRLDANFASEAEEELNRLADENVKLLINLEGLEYISSAGLRVLLVVAKKIRRNNGKMFLCCLSDNVSEVFEISGFAAIFDLAETETEAVRMLNS